MKLDTEFRKLPLCFDVDRLAVEAAQFAEREWRAHPQGHAGNSAIPLLAAHGDPDDDRVMGPMQPTPFLQRCPYLRQVLAALDTVLGRTRLMRIAGQGEAHAHVDTNYYWAQRVRVHVPVMTFPEVQFVCGGRALHMAAGETWIFDTWRLHNVLNPNARDRIHLVADTVGSASFWELVAGAERPFAAEPGPGAPPRRVPYVPGREPTLTMETFNFPVVMSPWEQESLIVRILEELAPTTAADGATVRRLEALLEPFHRQWRALWAQWGDTASGWPAFRSLLDAFETGLAPFEGMLALPNNLDVAEALRQTVVRPALNPDLAQPRPHPVRTASAREPDAGPARLDRPIFIVAAPRSGSTLLFETLARSPSVWTIGGESHDVFESIAKLDPRQRGFDSNRLTAADYDGETAATLRANFLDRLRDRQGRPLPSETWAVRLLEKTPKNALRVPFLNAIFPDARFIYLYREPHENLSSILSAWQSGQFVTYPHLPDWEGPAWSLLLIPQWRQLIGQPLAAIAAAQWETANRCLLDDLATLPPHRVTAVSYADVVAQPQATAERLCRFAAIGWDQRLEGALPLSRHTLTPPDPNKWRQHADQLVSVLPRLEGLAARAREWVREATARG